MTPPTHPDPSQLVDLPDGRQLAIDVTGPADGPAVVFLHAAPGSRRFDPSPPDTAAAGVRLVTVDRPGYGRSMPLPDDVVPTVASIADDLVAGLSLAGVDDFALAGWSAGGRFAAAVSARHPERVRALGIVATPAPDDQVPWVPEAYRQMATAMRADAAGAKAMLEPNFAGLVGHGGAATHEVASGPADEATLAADRDLSERVDAMLVEAFRSSASGLAVDIVSDQVVPWGFDPAAIGATTTCFSGDGDTVCGPEHGRWWAGAIPDARLHVVAGAGHLVVATAWADILASLVR